MPPAQSRDNPANLFMFLCFSFSERLHANFASSVSSLAHGVRNGCPGGVQQSLKHVRSQKLFICNKKEAKKAHKKKSYKISENPLEGRVSLEHPAGVPAKMPLSVRFSIANNRKSLGHRPVDPCLVYVPFSFLQQIRWPLVSDILSNASKNLSWTLSLSHHFSPFHLPLYPPFS